MSQTPVLTILEALKFDRWKNFTLKDVKISHKLKIRTAQVVKMAVFWLLNDQN